MPPKELPSPSVSQTGIESEEELNKSDSESSLNVANKTVVASSSGSSIRSLSPTTGNMMCASTSGSGNSGHSGHSGICLQTDDSSSTAAGNSRYCTKENHLGNDK